MSEIKSYYAIIPAEIRYDNKLDPISKLLYGEIIVQCNRKGICNIPIKYFSDLFKIKKRKVQKAFLQLEENGYIIIQKTKYFSFENMIKINLSDKEFKFILDKRERNA